jgi:signal peptidase II
LIAGILAVVFDQVVKQLIVRNFELGGTKSFIPGLLRLDYVRNYGASWNMLTGKRWFLIVVTIVAIIVIIVILAGKVLKHPLCTWGLTAIAAGGVGNLIDRVRLSYVADMFEFTFVKFPVFTLPTAAPRWA